LLSKTSHIYTILRYLFTSTFHLHYLSHQHSPTSFLFVQKVVFKQISPPTFHMHFLFIHTSHMPSRDFTALTIQGHLHKSWSPSLRNVLNYHFLYPLYRAHTLLSIVHSYTCRLYHSSDVRDNLPHSVYKTTGKVFFVIKSSRFLKGIRNNFQNEQKQLHDSLF